MVLACLLLVIALGVRQYLLYHRCQQAVAASDRLLFQFTSIKGHLNESLILGEEVNLQKLNRELQQLGGGGRAAPQPAGPEGLKPSLLSRVDLVNPRCGCVPCRGGARKSVREAAELVRALTTANIGLQQFRLHLGDHTQAIFSSGCTRSSSARWA